VKPFEIGVVYKSTRDLGVAFAANALLTFRNGKPRVIRPRVRVEVIRTLTVEGLCSRWNVTLEEMDAALTKKLPKPSSPHKAQRVARGPKRERRERDEEYRLVRSVRIARAR